MSWIWGLLGWLVIGVTLWDTFTTIVIPKAIDRQISLSSMYYRAAWSAWYRIATWMKDGPMRLALLSAFAPITLLILFLVWASLLVFGFALVQFGHGTLAGVSDLFTYLYFSGTTFFTLGFGDFTSPDPYGQFMSVAEAGTGFAFLAIVIGYIPVIYGHFSSREKLIVLLDSRAGSNPSSGELLRRHSDGGAMEDLVVVLKEWEEWSAQQLEAYLSYPILAFYRSQHDHQSWLCALTAVLDTCALIESGFEDSHPWSNRLQFQARQTFAMGRHVIVDLAYILKAKPNFKAPSRLPSTTFSALQELLSESGIPLRKDREAVFLAQRKMYEPYCIALAKNLFFSLPGWIPEPGSQDNWQSSAWDGDNHFESGATPGK